jgi:hypothetical protein
MPLFVLVSWFMIAKICRGLLLGVLGCPVACCLDGSVLVLLPALGDIVGEWIIGIRCAEECLDGEEDGADLEGGRPVACVCALVCLL